LKKGTEYNKCIIYGLTIWRKHLNFVCTLSMNYIQTKKKELRNFENYWL
jgi:hypothetical protein